MVIDTVVVGSSGTVMSSRGASDTDTLDTGPGKMPRPAASIISTASADDDANDPLPLPFTLAFAFFLGLTLGSDSMELEARALALFMAANPTRRGSEVSVLALDAVTSAVTLPLSGLPRTPANACIAELELGVTASQAEVMGESDIEALDIRCSRKCASVSNFSPPSAENPPTK